MGTSKSVDTNTQEVLVTQKSMSVNTTVVPNKSVQNNLADLGVIYTGPSRPVL